MNAMLHVISGLGMGGAERNLVQIVGELNRQSVRQQVICIGERGLLADAIEAHGGSVVALGIRSKIQAVGGMLRLARLIEQFKPAMIQGWMYHGNLLAALAHRLARGRTGRQVIWNLRASNVQERQHRQMLRWTAQISHWPDVIIANSQEGARFHLANGYKPRRLEVIANGIDTERFRPDAVIRAQVRSELGIAPDAVVAIHVARVNPMKDHPLVISAAASAPQMHFILVGKDTQSLKLPANARALGLRTDVDRLYAACDVVVSTSAYAEGFSNAIAEGMSAGLIPIATDVGDARLIVGETGTIIRPHGRSDFVRALVAEATRDATERSQRGLQARQRIVDHFGLARALEAYSGLYASLAQAKQ
jgi:glycosyltransferase involved in cell wall biosynthesis